MNELLSPAEALSRFEEVINGSGRREGRTEHVPLESALGRVLAETVISPAAIPSRAVSRVDGFAVKAEDTYGASKSIPRYLSISSNGEVGKNEAVEVRRGDKIPAGGDAVYPRGRTEIIRGVEKEKGGIKEIGVLLPLIRLFLKFKEAERCDVSVLGRFRLSRAVSSDPAAEEYIPCQVRDSPEGSEIVPLYGAASGFSGLSALDGFILVPMGTEAFSAGDKVTFLPAGHERNSGGSIEM